jgi:hypothetical protein
MARHEPGREGGERERVSVRHDGDALSLGAISSEQEESF